MDYDDIRSSLNALRKLYGLLTSDASNSPTSNSNLLDEKAQVLLKNLLDAETERVFKAQEKVGSAQIGASLTDLLSQLQKINDPQNHLFPCLSILSEASRGTRDYRKEISTLKNDPGFTKSGSQTISAEQSNLSFAVGDSGNRMRRCGICQRIREQPVENLVHIEASGTDNHGSNNVPRLQNQPGYQINQYLWDGEDEKDCETSRNILKDRQRFPNSICVPSGSGLIVSSSNWPATSLVKSEYVDTYNAERRKLEKFGYLSKDAYDVIKEIELRIASLEVRDKPLLGKAVAQCEPFTLVSTKTESDILVQRKGAAMRSEQSQTGECFVDRMNSALVTQRVHEPQDSSPLDRVPSTEARQLINVQLPPNPNSLGWSSTTLSQQTPRLIKIKINPDLGGDTPTQVELDSLDPSVSHNHHNPGQIFDGNGIRYPRGLKMSNKTQTFQDVLPNLIDEENRDVNRLGVYREFRISGTSKPSVQFTGPAETVNTNRKFQVVDSENEVSWTGIEQKKRGFNSGQPVVSPSLYRNWTGHNSKNVNQKNPRREALSKKLESEYTTSDSYSSSWTSRSASSCGDESGDCSLSGSIPSQTTSYGTEVSSPPRKSQRRYMVSSSSYENEAYSSQNSGSIYQGTSSSVGERGGYSPSIQQEIHQEKESAESMTGPSRLYRSANRRNPNKRRGGLKKLKDKLAIIFHHHHHHHHHHRADDNDQSVFQTKVSRVPARGKSRRETSCPTKEVEKEVEKVGKAAVGHNGVKNQHHHLRALVQRFMRHVRQSKESKSSKESIIKLHKERRTSKKALKKFPWWHVLHHHQRAKMPKKAQVKLGFGKKKPRLRPLPRA